MTNIKTALVSSMIAPLYCVPARGGELDDEALYGMKVELLEAHADDCYRIRAPYGYETFCGAEHLCFDADEIERYDPANRKMVASATLDVMAAPGVRAGHLMTLTLGATLEVLGADEGGWTRVRLIGGREGYVRSSHLCAFHTGMHGDEAHFRDSVVEWAKRFLGSQYRWGGRTPLGVDCSGLCSAAYYINGVSIYRNASIQDGYPIRPIARERMKKGDLLFFKGHVAMYMGEDKYIHSTGRAGDDGVVINSLSPTDPDYREDLEKGILAIGSIF